MMRRLRLLVLLACTALAFMTLSAAAQPRAGWPRSVTIGAASIGGVYYVIAGGYAKVIQEKMGIPASLEVTGGPEQNVALLQAKRIELALTTVGPAYEGIQGIGWADKKHDAIRVAFPMYISYAHWAVRADSGIRTVADLNGKVVQLGPRGGTAEFLGTRVLKLFNIQPRRVIFGSFAEGANGIRDGLVDAAFGVIGIPVPAWVELAVTRPARFIGFTKDQVELLTSRFPYVSRAAIRAGVYKGQDEVINTVSMWNTAMVHKDMPDDFVYELVKTMHANTELLTNVHAVGAEHLPVNIYYINLPLHPGAVRYYTEQNLTLKPSQLPTK